MSVICPVCGLISDDFQPRYDRLAVICPNCGSFERHRHQILVFNKILRNRIKSDSMILHIAPEECIGEKIRRIGKYTTLDLKMKNVNINASLTEIPLRNSSIDLIWCSHVLEHIKDVDKAIEEIYRVMHVNGFFLVDVPITEKKNYKIEIPN
jgi:SAM-dependent methyltransferase